MREFSFEEVWALLEEPSKRVHEALLDAISNADRMEALHTELCRDGNMWSQHVRAYLANVLPVVLDPQNFVLDRRYNISLTVIGPEVAARIRKAAPGQMPQPGSGPRSLDFFNQATGQWTLPGTEKDESEAKAEPERAPHFIWKWAVDENGQLCELDLGYPKPTVREFGQPDVPQEWFWVQPIFDMTRPAFFGGPSLFQELDVPDVELLGDDEDEAKGEDEGTGTE